MFETGFLGTKAPMFMDIVTLIVILLPLLLKGSILFAKHKMYYIHKQTQIGLFIITIFVIIFFEYGVRLDGGINKYLMNSDISDSFIIGFLAFHITVATIAISLWGRLFYLSLKALKANQLPGQFSTYHKKLANMTINLVILASISGCGVYYLLFM